MAIGRRREAFRPGTVANQHSLALLYFAFTIYFRFRDLPASVRTLLCFAEFLLRSFVPQSQSRTHFRPSRGYILIMAFPRWPSRHQRYSAGRGHSSPQSDGYLDRRPHCLSGCSGHSAWPRLAWGPRVG